MAGKKLDNTINSLYEKGDALLNADDFEGALALYRQAERLIPEPKYDHDLSLGIYTAIGESFFYMNKYEYSIEWFMKALKCADGIDNPLVHLRLGQAYYELGDHEQAANALTCAYMIEGAEIFEHQDAKYLDFLSKHIKM